MSEAIKINVGVVFGGRSVEHEVSIISALQAMAALNMQKYQPIPIYIAKDGQWYSGEVLRDLDLYQDMKKIAEQAHPIELSVNYNKKEIFAKSSGLLKKPWSQRIDIILPVVHGTTVEDGCLQGLLEIAGIPYAGPAVLGSAVGMDKTMMKAVLKEAGVPLVEYRAFAACQWHVDEKAVVERIETAFAYPLVVKPANLGSSIGITMVANQEELIDAIELAFSFSTRILVEKAVVALREINCAVLGAPGNMECSVCEEPLAAEEILSFADKYLSSSNKGMSGAKRRLLAEDDPLAEKIRSLAMETFACLDCRGVCRVDFLIDTATDQVFVNEINTIPGSLSFYLFEPKGLSFGDLLERLIKLGLDRKREQDKLTTVYSSNILAQGGFKGKK